MGKIKILQVGCGKISSTWLEVFSMRRDVKVVGLVDINEKYAMEKRSCFGLQCEIFTDLHKAIEKTIPDIIVDNTSPEAHFKVVMTALENGCHVFGEKPISDSIEDAIEMVKKANKTKKSYFIMQNRRYFKGIRTFRKIIEDGSIGDLGFLYASFYIGTHFNDYRDFMDSPMLIERSIHVFDQARFISNSEALSVYCHEFNPSYSWFKGNACVCCIFEMTNKMVFSFNGSWCSSGNETGWQSEWRANGSNGSVVWDGESIPSYEFLKKENEPLLHRITPDNVWKHQEGHAGCIDEMIMAIRNNKACETDCNDNIKSFAMVMAAIKSAREKRKVFVNEIFT